MFTCEIDLREVMYSSELNDEVCIIHFKPSFVSGSEFKGKEDSSWVVWIKKKMVRFEKKWEKSLWESVSYIMNVIN